MTSECQVVDELDRLLVPKDVTSQLETRRRHVAPKTTSGAFPGLECRFEVLDVDARVAPGKLPQADFETQRKTDDGKTHTCHWTWRPRSTESDEPPASLPAAGWGLSAAPPGESKALEDSVREEEDYYEEDEEYEPGEGVALDAKREDDAVGLASAAPRSGSRVAKGGGAACAPHYSTAKLPPRKHHSSLGSLMCTGEAKAPKAKAKPPTGLRWQVKACDRTGGRCSAAVSPSPDCPDCPGFTSLDLMVLDCAR